MIYLCAGVFAEGRSDYGFLLPLVNRLLYELSTAVPHATEVADSVGIDASRPIPRARAERIAKAIQEHEGQCTLFVIHADADGDHEAALPNGSIREGRLPPSPPPSWRVSPFARWRHGCCPTA